MKILLIEDHPAVAQISSSQLREIHGHDVRHAATGEDALAAVGDFAPDLVLLDVNLPDMCGYDVAARLRADLRWKDTILVALTGFGAEVDPARVAAAGIDACFQKPMDFGLLPTLKRRDA